MTSSRRLVVSAVLVGLAVLAPFTGAARQTSGAWPPPPIDPQIVRDQDDMTWDDYKPIPGTAWNDPTKEATNKTIRLAIVMADFEDQPFVMTLPKHSDKYGNPQVDGIPRDKIVDYTRDFYTKPIADNHGHTIHEYWMEQSRGKVGVAVTVFGPYRMPAKTYQYGMDGMNRGTEMPYDEKPSAANFQTDIDKLWQADAGADVRTKFDLVMRTFAGYDESSVWQEFGEMKFQTKNDITPEFGNPDPSKPRWAKTRYVEWTSWDAAKWVWSNSAIITGEASGAIRHEVSHAAFRIGDNYNNPYVQPFRRVGAGPWDLMDRGSFNGPGGPHKRYLVPKTEGDVMSAGLMLRQKIAFGFVTNDQVLTIKRDDLAKVGLVVANVTARATDPVAPSLAGIVIRLDDGTLPPAGGPGGPGGPGGAGGGALASGRGAAGGRGTPPPVTPSGDHTPVEDPTKNPLWSGTPNYNFYSMEVVQRMGYDSFEPDSGVLIAKNKDQASAVGGPNSFSVFNWVIDAHPEDINKVDFKRPDGTPVMRTIADYRQLNDALFHAGTNSGSAFEWADEPNKLKFYVVDVQRDARGVLSYTLAVRSLEGSGPDARGVTLAGPAAGDLKAGTSRSQAFTLTNSGTGTSPDLYRLTATIEGSGWAVSLPNALATAKPGESTPITAWINRAATSAGSATLTITATSETDPTKTSKVAYAIK